MTTQDYINEELAQERQHKWNTVAGTQQFVGWIARFEADHAQMCANPPELILLRAKVRELTDKLEAETQRCMKIVQGFDHGWSGDDARYADIIKERIARRICHNHAPSDCAPAHPEPVSMCGRLYGVSVCKKPKGHIGSCVSETVHYGRFGR